MGFLLDRQLNFRGKAFSKLVCFQPTETPLAAAFSYFFELKVQKGLSCLDQGGGVMGTKLPVSHSAAAAGLTPISPNLAGMSAPECLMTR